MVIIFLGIKSSSFSFSFSLSGVFAKLSIPARFSFSFFFLVALVCLCRPYIYLFLLLCAMNSSSVWHIRFVFRNSLCCSLAFYICLVCKTNLCCLFLLSGFCSLLKKTNQEATHHDFVFSFFIPVFCCNTSITCTAYAYLFEQFFSFIYPLIVHAGCFFLHEQMSCYSLVFFITTLACLT